MTASTTHKREPHGLLSSKRNLYMPIIYPTMPNIKHLLLLLS